MENQNKAVQAQPEVCWDANMKEDAMDFVSKISRQMRKYLSHAIEYANTKNKEPNEIFWECLFYKSGPNPTDYIMKSNDEDNPSHPPANPYRRLDVQACCKYLLYGEKRAIPERIRFPGKVNEDSEYFYKTFELQGKKKQNYRRTLFNAKDIRNDHLGHSTDQKEEDFSSEKLEYIINVYQDITKPLERSKAAWYPEDLQRIPDYWASVEQTCRRQFGSAPLSLEELGQDLFGTTEALTQEQWDRLNQIVEFFNLDVHGLDAHSSKVYQQPSREDLLDRMRRFLSKGRMTQEAAQAATEEQRQAK